MEKVKITTISPGKSGVNEKTGKSWSLLNIKVEGKDYEIKGFANKTTEEWTVGSIVNLEIKNDQKWGWQFKIPTATDNLEARVDVLEETVNALLRAVPSAVVEIKKMSENPNPTAQTVVDKIEGEPESVPIPEEDDLPF